MDINNLIEQYGYVALVIGSVAEGETITLLGGVAAHQGLLRFPLVVAAVALGGMIGDQLLYLLGLRFGPALLKRFKKHQKKINRAQRLIQRLDAGGLVAIVVADKDFHGPGNSVENSSFATDCSGLPAAFGDSRAMPPVCIGRHRQPPAGTPAKTLHFRRRSDAMLHCSLRVICIDCISREPDPPC